MTRRIPAHANQEPALVDDAKHSDVSTAVGATHSMQRWPMAARQRSRFLAECAIIYGQSSDEAAARYASHHLKPMPHLAPP
jgi:hypothetical protein